jgi:hypothetical protein
MSAERLWQVVEADHRAKVLAADVAYSRYRPRDELAKVKVLSSALCTIQRPPQ